MQSQIIQSASLFNTQAGRDAEYHCQIVASEGGYLLNYQNGRRGSALATGTKTTAPVDLSVAEKAFAKLVKEKTAKGYLPADTAIVNEFGGSTEPTETLQLPQLLNSIKEEDVEQYIADTSFGMMEKMDGKRVQISFKDGKYKVSNKLGKPCTVPKIILDQISTLKCDIEGVPITDFHADGELIGSTLYVFDALSLRGVNLKNWPFENRHQQLTYLLNANPSATNLVSVDVHFTEAAKRAEFNRIKAEHGEGVVFQQLDQPYTVGRPNSGGHALKFKFRAEASCQCLGQSKSTKRSVKLGLLDAHGNIVEVGNVTVPGKLPIPDAGSVIEVIYLYKYIDGAFEQPVWKMLRDDVALSECNLSQIKRLKKKISDRDSDED